MFTLEAEAPALTASGSVVIDLPPDGNGDGNANAGETVDLQLWITNTGHSDADELTGTLSCFHPSVVIHDATGTCSSVPEQGDAVMGDFVVEFLESCPEPTHIAFSLAVSGPHGFQAALEYEIPVGGWFDDFEADRGWTVGAAGDDASAGIWERVDPIGTTYNGNVVQMEDDHTPAPGTDCYVTGNGSVGGAAGENDVDGGKTTLLSPVFRIDGAMAASISYWRWYTNRHGNNPNEDWWDVAVTDDGQTWVALEHTQASEEAWVEFTFDLTDYIDLTDAVQFRFVASDGGSGSLVEAGVDDFLLNAIWPVATDVQSDLTMVPVKLAMRPNFPNPFNPVTTMQFDLPARGVVDLTIFDVNGRAVATLARGPYDAGTHSLRWEGNDADGHPVASGVYFSRLTFDGEVLTGRLLLIK